MIKRQASNRSQASDKTQIDPYNTVHSNFRWQVDEYFNIAEVCCSRWTLAEGAGSKVAIQIHPPGSGPASYSYLALKQAADALSLTLQGLGVQRGDRVAIVMPQRFETAVAYMAVLQMGAVAMPLSMLFGPEALQFRLHDSAAVLAICDESSITSIKAVRADCPMLRRVLATGGAKGQGDLDFDSTPTGQVSAFTAVKTKADEAAVLIYTSGTTGPPKGALIPHRALIGNLPGFVCSQNWFGFDGKSNKKTAAVFWSPAD